MTKETSKSWQTLSDCMVKQVVPWVAGTLRVDALLICMSTKQSMMSSTIALKLCR